MSDILTAMPVLARHAGEWKGRYIYLDLEGNVTDSHASHLTCMFPTEGEWDYYQINRYTWDDGRYEERHFPARYENGRIYWDNELIRGHAWEIDHRTVALTWVRKGEPGLYLYEMIQLSTDGKHRARTWHWFRDDRLFLRTIISEVRLV